MLAVVACGRLGDGTHTKANPIEASAAAAPVERHPEKPTGPSSPRDQIAAQLDRIDHEFRDPALRPFAASDAYLAKIKHYTDTQRLDPDKLRTLSRIEDPKLDPRGALALVSVFLQADPRVTFKMIRKNPKKYAGSAYWLRNAKIVEIHEDEGTTMARVSEDGDVYFVGSRFESPFVEGDTVDIVGYVGGEFSNGNITMPAIAAAGIMKGDAVAAMNRIAKWFTGF